MSTQTTLRPDSPASTAEPWWKGAVIYQLYIRSFADSNGDGIGDLAGATARLDHIARLGCDGVWVTPFYTSPMKDFGYDVADYQGVDPIFGTIDDFDAFVTRAHALGLKVLIDLVFSHSSDQHPWFRESRSSRHNSKADWYVWADPKADGSPPNNWQSVFGGPSWTWDARREQYYHHNFLKDQPQLNGHHPAVQKALLDAARFWLDRGVDGFRLDALNFTMHDPALTDNPPVANPEKRTRPFDFQHHIHNQSHSDVVKFIERIQALLDSYPGRFSLAEVGGEQASSEMKTYTAGEGRLNSAYGFDYLYADRLTPDVVRDTIRNWPGGAGEGWPSWAFSNHDAPRFASRWWEADTRPQMVRVAMLLLMCLRGNAILYQGEELGLPQANIPFEKLRDPEAIANWPQTLGRDGARSPLPWTEAPDGGFGSADPWLPVDPAHLALSVESQEDDPSSILHWTRRMIALRHAEPALRCGTIRLVDCDPRLLAFERAADGQVVLCLFNLGDEAVPVPSASGQALVTAGEPIVDGVLPPHSAAIIRKG
ncbi:DUF3459 domain-containing protein [Sphingomonas rhizophila]|uniref:DUF3459 domain-containing protein n=1 Tax=Sphingomonas rhizophila TaxID=2071607 RepID=A0A7G9SBX9_9SPHN|nr:alpha-amylase family glycosyl hydrolase [Sphingomonas rhizophila]QNN65354.1 DUF3459 domain-containing protein [Sphingomonas rhizophila]